MNILDAIGIAVTLMSVVVMWCGRIIWIRAKDHHKVWAFIVPMIFFTIISFYPWLLNAIHPLK